MKLYGCYMDWVTDLQLIEPVTYSQLLCITCWDVYCYEDVLLRLRPHVELG